MELEPTIDGDPERKFVGLKIRNGGEFETVMNSNVVMGSSKMGSDSEKKVGEDRDEVGRFGVGDDTELKKE